MLLKILSMVHSARHQSGQEHSAMILIDGACDGLLTTVGPQLSTALAVALTRLSSWNLSVWLVIMVYCMDISFSYWRERKAGQE